MLFISRGRFASSLHSAYYPMHIVLCLHPQQHNHPDDPTALCNAAAPVYGVAKHINKDMWNVNILDWASYKPLSLTLECFEMNLTIWMWFERVSKTFFYFIFQNISTTKTYLTKVVSIQSRILIWLDQLLTCCSDGCAKTPEAGAAGKAS